MNRIRFRLLCVVLFAASCNYPITSERARTGDTGGTPTDTGAGPASTPARAATDTQPTADWKGGVFWVETQDLMIEYPDFLDPAEARNHADALQNAYGTYRILFGFGDEKPYGGMKTNVVLRPEERSDSADFHQINVGKVAIDLMKAGYLNPPDMTFFHEMVHVYEFAEMDAKRYYIFAMIAGINEAFATYFACHPEILALMDENPNAQKTCDVFLRGLDAKSPEMTLDYYEAEKVDPYTLDWGRHPAGASGENYFQQMLARVSDAAGWNVWTGYFARTRNPGIDPDVWKEAEVGVDDMNHPLAKQAFAGFVADLGDAAGRDLRPMFRGWGFAV